MNDLISRQEFTPVLCVTGGDGYEEGKVYPMMGWNNGVHILRVNEFGDVIDREFCTGGYGKGLFNSFMNEGYPSFDELPSAQPEIIRCKDCKHRIFDGSRDLLYCEMYYGLGSVMDNNFCSYGERGRRMTRYIDADKLIELANNTKDKTLDANDIARFPIADARENVRGKWWHEPHNNNTWIQRCSNCFNTAMITIKEECPYNYCPICGADMRGVEE